MAALQEMAQELGVPERTLRRAAHDGTLRLSRRGPRRVRISDDERQYLRGHWALLASLRKAFRSEPNVEFAVLYGSTARGDADADSDVDLLVSLKHRSPRAWLKLSMRLERAIGREVDVGLFDDVEQRSPLLMLQALDEGRVIVDRSNCWPQLLARRRALRARAERHYARQMCDAREAIHELVSG